MRLLLENVRGFAGTHSLAVKPLTILVGENSSGKTTLLSTLFIALQADFPTADAFNRSPFELGSFDTIATYRGGKYGRAPTFSIGWEAEADEAYSLKATFEGHLGIPRIREIDIRYGSAKLVGSFVSGEWSLQESSKQPFRFTVPTDSKSSPSLNDLLRLAIEQASAHRNAGEKNRRFSIELLFELTTLGNRIKPRATALAPLRSRPHRTYDELIEEFKPEGDHVPLVLARALANEGRPDRELASSLEAFGRESGLFQKLKVRRMGRQPSDPFQLRVKSAGPDANLVDVGYGVSQALPVVVDSYLAPNNRVVLIQQPEVHLHPRAQAALGSFFCELAKSSTKRFVIETHSDYLLDRVRQAVANRVLPREAVNIAFLERDGLDVLIHQLELDERGNIVNAPAAYRSFFLQEEMRLMFRGQ